MQLLISFLLVLLLFNPALKAETLHHFETDFCTGYVEGTKKNPNLWKHCCLEHDLYFWAGGSKKDRSESDQRLRTCVALTGQKFHAHLMFIGIRLGGLSPIKIKNKQWGNGWSSRKAYDKLTEQETFELIHFLEITKPELDEKLKSSFVNQLKSRLD